MQMIHTQPIRHTFKLSISIAMCVIALSGCQLLAPKLVPAKLQPIISNDCTTPVAQSTLACLSPFSITGKIGLKSPAQSGSAFYAWSQHAGFYQLELTGILGIAQTTIIGSPDKATLQNSKVGLIEATDPESLLLTATGWQAPINALPFWIMGKSSQTTNIQKWDTTGRINEVLENGWLTQFDYTDTNTLPNKLTMTKSIDGADYRVILTVQQRDAVDVQTQPVQTTTP